MNCIDNFVTWAVEQNICVEQNVNLANFCTFHTGGLGKVAVYPNSIIQLDLILNNIKKLGLPFVVLGRGSNVLISDLGFDGVVVSIGKRFAQLVKRGNFVFCEAGCNTTAIANFCENNSLSGAEFLGSLPASIGGAVAINAGCFGYEMANTVASVYATNGNGIVKFTANQCDFSYRHSVFDSGDFIVGVVCLRLDYGQHRAIYELTRAIATKKLLLQPINERCAGSVFLRGKDYFPAQLIDNANLKGVTFGGAQISKKHCGFVVNVNKATSEEIATLIDFIEKTIDVKYGIKLIREIKYIGEFNTN